MNDRPHPGGRPKVTFILSKDPTLEHGGDVAMSRMVMRLAASTCDVSAICLSSETGPIDADLVPGGMTLNRVRKTPVDKARVLAASVGRRRSLVHVRFDLPALIEAIDVTDADVFVAEHSYMAESFLKSSRFGHRGLVVNTVNTESQVWLATRGLLGRVEAPRLLRDEIRVALAAASVGTYDFEEAQMYRDHGQPAARWLDLTLPPAQQADIGSSGRRLGFVGVRDWPPNQEAFLHALKLWPRIAAGIPDAELCIVGPKKPGAADPPYPAGVRELGFVEDLGAFLRSCRALMAPVKTGGGVRVKILDSISKGLPIVGTGAAVGSLTRLFDLATFDDDDAFVDQCRRYLLDRDAAAAAGATLYDGNVEHWQSERPHHAVGELVKAALR